MSSFSIFCTGVDGDPKIIPNGVDIVVSQYNSLEPGGPVRAELLANGPSSALADLFDWLGAELEIRTSRGTPIWWGRVTTVLIRFGGMEFGLTTVGMINKVAVDYTTERIGGASDAFTTDWVDDTESINISRGGRTSRQKEQNSFETRFSRGRAGQ